MKIAIIACAHDAKDAPYGDESWTIWNMGKNYAMNMRFDRWFEMHSLDIVRANSHPSFINFLDNAGSKLYSGFPNDFPKSTPYPVHILDKYRRYMTSSVAYMIALAIEENPEEIGIWGVDMTGDTEYAVQRPACEYLLGLAEGKGIKITTSNSCPLLKTKRMYALEYSELSHEMTDTLKDLEGAIQEATRKAMEGEYYKGQKVGLATAHEVLTRMKRRWG